MSIEFIVKDSEFSYGLKDEYYQTIYLCCMKPECESGDTCKHKREQYHVILTPKILARYNDIEYEHSWFVYDISEQKLLETKNAIITAECLTHSNTMIVSLHSNIF